MTALPPKPLTDLPTEWLNFLHLHYFWLVAREGSLSRAAERLRLSHSTLSSQIRKLEGFLEGELFDRRGRRLVLTPLGEDVAAYADDIFRLGAELVDAARGRGASRRKPLRIGHLSVLPKSLVLRLLEPALTAGSYGPLVARQESLPVLLEDLASGRLHLVLTDTPPPEGSGHRVFAHLLGESKILLYGSQRLARKCRRGFPASLDGAPMLLPTAGSALRRALTRWFAEHGVRPIVAGEFDDAGLMRVYGGSELGLFPVREALRAEVEERFNVELVGRVEGVRERYYAISSERRVRHPAATALIETARARLEPPTAVTKKPTRAR